MPAVLTPEARALLTVTTHRMAICWQISRVDGLVQRFTSHDAPLVLADGNSYTPVVAVDGSALSREQSLKVTNIEMSGAIAAGYITEDDLMAGRYRDAAVVEYVVDWRYPWTEPFQTNFFWIADTKYDSEQWSAQVEGLGGYLEQVIGGTFTRNCEYTLGDTGPGNCNFDLATVRRTSVVTGIAIDRRVFDTTLTDPRAYHNLGMVKWTSGLNLGIQVDVKAYAATGRTFLWLETPFDIQIGDEFTIVPGCDGNFTTCRDKFNNVVNHGGHPDIPGTDYTLTTPNTQ